MYARVSLKRFVGRGLLHGRGVGMDDTWTRRSLWAVIAVLATAGCATSAKQMGSSATQGAISQLKAQIDAIPPEEQGLLMERAAAGATRGVWKEVFSPEAEAELSSAIQAAMLGMLQRLAHPPAGQGGAPIQELSRQLGDGAADGALARFEQHLGSTEQPGPLAVALVGSAGSVTAAATSGLRSGLVDTGMPCDAACLERRVEKLGQSAFTGFAEGLTRSLKWPLLFVVFVLGLLFRTVVREVTVVAMGATGWLRRRREKRHVS